MDGNKTVRSLAGLRRDSEIMFLDKGGQFYFTSTFSFKKGCIVVHLSL
jgi:hypothetical protein